MADDFTKDDASEARGTQEHTRVRVMSDRESADYNGITIEETANGHTYETPHEDDVRRAHVVFETAGTGDIFSAALRQILGPHWKWKLGLAVGAIVFGLVFFFIALPVLSVLCVAAAVLWIVGRFLHG